MVSRLLARLTRALRIRCPNCGQGPLFKAWSFRMLDECQHCQMDFRREPGFYLGSIYINYGITSAAVLVAYLVMAFGMRSSMNARIAICLTLAIGLPLLLFRHSRSLWLAFDSLIDSNGNRPHGPGSP